MELNKDRDNLIKEIKNHFLWYHSFDLGNGEKVTGIIEEKGGIPEQRYTKEFSFYHIPKSLEGLSVLEFHLSLQ